MALLPILSNIFGWLYVACWGLVAYPQIYLNFKLKSVEGFKLDFPFLNLSGFTFYSLAFSVGYFGTDLPLNNYGLGTVTIQDVVFAYHGIFVSVIFNLQALFLKRGKNTISRFAVIFTILCWLTALFFFMAINVWKWIPITQDLNIVEILGDLKIAITFVKYPPLIYWNWMRKSTQGFSIISFLLDLAGGVFSLTQEGIDLSDGTTVTLNPVKTGLGVICIIYDLILMFQHFVLYRSNNRKIEKEEPLLGSPTTATSQSAKTKELELEL